MFYEHEDKYFPLKIILRDVVGYYNDYKDNNKYDSKYSAKRMNFKLDDDSLYQIYHIFDCILITLHMKVRMKNILKQLYLMKHALEKIIK